MSSDPTEYAAVTEYLFGLKARGVKFGIDRMRLLVDAIGHPERAVPMIHLAGTNGKGSVAAMLDAILHAAGWRTGLYTSPHLVKLGERVQVDRRILSEAEITAYVRELRPAAEALGRVDPDDHPSFFEFMTAMAFCQFARRRCDIGVVEVGMGGRLDATNVVTPEVSVITSIGLDHCEFLGDDLAQIAGEKAGIVKPGRPVVIGRMPAVAEQVIRAKAQAESAAVIAVTDIFGDDVEGYPHTNLEGDYQRWNAATATLVARALPAQWKITESAITAGLQQVDWPGRWQRVRLDGRLLILDASHNPEGAAVLADNLQHLVAETGRRPVVITGALGMARARPLMETISRFAREIHLVVPQQARACSHAELRPLIPADFRGQVAATTVEALFPLAGGCVAGGPDDVVVVTGSIYLLGEVMVRLEPQRGPGEGRLQDF
ncbi:MAG: bifunctional folylpolyglutamate synthase/dihydrofolate synthase [Opitutaceae bacterium]|nr:bifunctional folylpolyglutamate synthase/dihydrofolate synthase [Opitutaceae bacterium]MBP9912680.1 bifunctional folylpolyglutamate synthase/dihydrofolate synthase [Opitutaceae bacterium]